MGGSFIALGETLIVDADGRILGRMRGEAGEGFVIAEVKLCRKMPPADPIPQRFWIPHLPLQFRLVWALQNLHGRIYYNRKTLSFRSRPKPDSPFAAPES